MGFFFSLNDSRITRLGICVKSSRAKPHESLHLCFFLLVWKNVPKVRFFPAKHGYSQPNILRVTLQVAKSVSKSYAVSHFHCGWDNRAWTHSTQTSLGVKAQFDTLRSPVFSINTPAGAPAGPCVNRPPRTTATARPVVEPEQKPWNHPP